MFPGGSDSMTSFGFTGDINPLPSFIESAPKWNERKVGKSVVGFKSSSASDESRAWADSSKLVMSSASGRSSSRTMISSKRGVLAFPVSGSKFPRGSFSKSFFAGVAVVVVVVGGADVVVGGAAVVVSGAVVVVSGAVDVGRGAVVVAADVVVGRDVVVVSEADVVVGRAIVVVGEEVTMKYKPISVEDSVVVTISVVD